MTAERASYPSHCTVRHRLLPFLHQPLVLLAPSGAPLLYVQSADPLAPQIISASADPDGAHRKLTLMARAWEAPGVTWDVLDKDAAVVGSIHCGSPMDLQGSWVLRDRAGQGQGTLQARPMPLWRQLLPPRSRIYEITRGTAHVGTIQQQRGLLELRCELVLSDKDDGCLDPRLGIGTAILLLLWLAEPRALAAMASGGDGVSEAGVV